MAPAELEALLLEHAAIADVAVVGVTMWVFGLLRGFAFTAFSTFPSLSLSFECSNLVTTAFRGSI